MYPRIGQAPLEWCMPLPSICVEGGRRADADAVPQSSSVRETRAATCSGQGKSVREQGAAGLWNSEKGPWSWLRVVLFTVARHCQDPGCGLRAAAGGCEHSRGPGNAGCSPALRAFPRCSPAPNEASEHKQGDAPPGRRDSVGVDAVGDCSTPAAGVEQQSLWARLLPSLCPACAVPLSRREAQRRHAGAPAAGP